MSGEKKLKKVRGLRREYRLAATVCVILLFLSLLVLSAVNKIHGQVRIYTSDGVSSLNVRVQHIDLGLNQDFSMPVLKAKYTGITFSSAAKNIPVKASITELSSQEEALSLVEQYSKEDKDIEASVSSIDTTRIGFYAVSMKASYGKKKAMMYLTVDVKDIEPPVISLVSDPEHYTSPVGHYEEEGYTAIDDVDGDITEQVYSEERDGKVYYEVTDSSGNVGRAVRDIIYKDIVAPEISFADGAKGFVNLGDSFDPKAGVSATDDVDGDVTESIQIEGSVDTSKVGICQLVYKAYDKSGNEASLVRQIRVRDPNKADKDPTDKVIYLTFDDGPGKYTQQLLDILDKYNVKVTFFVTNQYSDYTNLIGEEYRRGHTVAIHSYSHVYSKIYASTGAYFDDLNMMSAVCQQQTGVTPSIVRFPGGASNAISKKYCPGIMSQLVQQLPARGYQYCDWNVSSGDAGGRTTPSVIYNNVVEGCSSHSVSVVLQHDVHDFSVDAVEDIIKWGLSEGYTFLPLTDSSKMVHHKVNN